MQRTALRIQPAILHDKFDPKCLAADVTYHAVISSLHSKKNDRKKNQVKSKYLK